ncbi:MAG: DNA polymerase IV [Candidatus Saccharimonadales bacterium]
MANSKSRKVIHVDMDAFYASVEQRDNPELKGKPIAVGYADKRGVIMTASYVARQFGVHSALPSATAKNLCPDLIIIEPHFDKYHAVSKQIQAIFKGYTDLVEPVALDEAYLDVTTNKKNIPSAWTTAQVIRDKIFAKTGLTASAGVSYNKFLAKTASSMRKPNGQYLIAPENGQAFIDKLPIAKFHGIGEVTARKMHELGIYTGADLKEQSLELLQDRFGKVGTWYYQIAHGEDNRPVEPNRERKSFSAETTFGEDSTDKGQLEESISALAGQVWEWAETAKMYGRTVTIKIKYADFQKSTRSQTSLDQIIDGQEFRRLAIELINSVLPTPKAIRLVGVGLSNFNVVGPKATKQTSFSI